MSQRVAGRVERIVLDPGHLGDALTAPGSDPSVAAVVLTVAGRGFWPEAAPLSFPDLEALRRCPVPVLLAVDGLAYGPGLSLCLTADLVYASERARFGQPAAEALPALRARIGPMRAAELALAGRRLRAQAAYACGLCLDVLPAHDLVAHVMAVAAAVAEGGSAAARARKADLLAPGL